MKRVGDVLSTIFDEDLLKQARGYSTLFSCWKDLTEKNGIAAAADHSWIKSLDHGLVWIEVDHPGWKQILQTKESKLLSDFHRRFPDMDISGISIALCRPGTHIQYDEPELADKAAVETMVSEKSPSPEYLETASTADGYNAIKEGALKEALMRLEESVSKIALP